MGLVVQRLLSSPAAVVVINCEKIKIPGCFSAALFFFESI